jgi:hypothetical protein
MITLPHSPVIPAAGLFAAVFVLLAGSVLTMYIAGRAGEEPPISFRDMTRPVVRVAVALAAVAAVGLVLIWFVAAAFISDTGCAWIVGVGGCLPGH